MCQRYCMLGSRFLSLIYNLYLPVARINFFSTSKKVANVNFPQSPITARPCHFIVMEAKKSAQSICKNLDFLFFSTPSNLRGKSVALPLWMALVRVWPRNRVHSDGGGGGLSVSERMNKSEVRSLTIVAHQHFKNVVLQRQDHECKSLCSATATLRITRCIEVFKAISLSPSLTPTIASRIWRTRWRSRGRRSASSLFNRPGQ